MVTGTRLDRAIIIQIISAIVLDVLTCFNGIHHGLIDVLVACLCCNVNPILWATSICPIGFNDKGVVAFEHLSDADDIVW
jgi:hypothetical protein